MTKFKRNRQHYLFIGISLTVLGIFIFLFSFILPSGFTLFANNVILAMVLYLFFAYLLRGFKTFIIAFLSYGLIFTIECIQIYNYMFHTFVEDSFLGNILFLGEFSPTELTNFTIGIFLAVVLDLVLISKYYAVTPVNKNKLILKLTSYTAIFGFITLFIVFGFNNDINTVYYEIDVPQLPEELQGLRIAHISDTHSSSFPEGSNGLIAKVAAENPDLIFMTGDIVDDQEPFDETAVLMEGIKDIAPIYYVFGNHEFWSEDFWERREKMLSYGVTILENENEYIDVNGATIQISGVDDPVGVYDRPEKNTIEENLASMNNSESESDLELLLSHRPEIVDLYGQYDYDVVFSGHAHGGLVRIPFLVNGVYAPNQGFFPQYAGGVYNLESENPNGTQMVVSRGLSLVRHQRVFNPPELVIVTLV